ncbi:MAG: peptidylprolyl isomerase [Clostridia bacterium]|nr:peptidylprolyl isomerase [Clostridia bacterium]
MKRILRVTAAFLSLLLLLLCCTGCAASRPVYASPRALRVVATAGDVDILYEELYFITMNRIAEMKSTYGEDVLADGSARAELQRFVWDNLCTRETALISLGYEYGLDVHKGEIADNVQLSIDDILENDFGGDREAYVESLAEMYMTDHYARTYLGVGDYLANAIVLEMLYRGEVETDDAAVLATLKSDSFIRTVHVFVDKTNGAYTKEQHRAHAEEIYAAVSAATTNEARYDAMYDAIGGRYNYDFGDPLGHGYYFPRGEMKAAYEDAAFALAEYEVSPVVETEDGYYVIMRLPKSDAYINEHFETLKTKSYFVTLNQRVEEKLAGMTLERTRFGEKLDLTALSPIDPDGGTAVLVAGFVALAVIVCGVVVLVAMKFSRRRGKVKSR